MPRDDPLIPDRVEIVRRKLSLLSEDLREIRDQGKKAIGNPSEVHLFKGMCRTLSSTYEKFDALYNELCDMITDPEGTSAATAVDYTKRANARRYLHEAYSHLELIESNNASTSTMSGNSSFSGSGSRGKSKLPTIPLPEFYGDIRLWPRFRDTFESLVRDDPELSNMDKFHYLLASLKKSAAAVIAKVPLSADHFEIAWKTLKNTYDNKRLLASAYLDQLLEFNRLKSKPNVETLNNVISDLSETVAAIELLHIPNLSEFIFFHLASRCLDTETREAFEISNKVGFPSFDNLIEFLRGRYTSSQLAIGVRLPTNYSLSPRPVRRSTSPKYALHANPTPKKVTWCTEPLPPAPASMELYKQQSVPNQMSQEPCPVCSGTHKLVNCVKFASTLQSERAALLKNWKGCRNCLQSGHVTRTCKSKWRCRFCHKSHHHLLHIEIPTSNTGPSKGRLPSGNHTSSQGSYVNQPSAALNSLSPHEVEVMLGTAECGIKNHLGKIQPVRLAIDSGSHFSFVTSGCAKRLGLTIDRHAPAIWGVGETPLKGFQGRAVCALTSMLEPDVILPVSAVVVDTITTPLPGFNSPEEMWSSYRQYPLADPNFWVTRPIEFLLGCDLFNDILTGPVINVKANMPKLLGTILGHVVLGRVKDIAEASRLSSLLSSHESDIVPLQDELHRFWALDEPPEAQQKLSPEDEQCEEYFRKTHARLPCGRYIVRLPFKVIKPLFGDSRGQALRRLSHLEKRLERNHLLRKKYNEFLAEYLALGHMELATCPAKYIIPHHCVIKDQGEDIKIRVVFDAAARTTTGSLNDKLLVGPKLQGNISFILLNFRQHQYVFTADAVKMFRQIMIHPNDRVYQHILWRFSPDDAVQEYELRTVSYGQSSAPYLAHRVLQQLRMDEGDAFPLAAAALKDDLYVDDLATGASTLDTALDLQREVIALMNKGGFSMSKWAANHPDLLASVTNDALDAGHPERTVSFEESNTDPVVKILGLQWDPSTDNFIFKIVPPVQVSTKRSVLSAVSKIFDPLGFLGPTVVLAKELVQAAWKRNLSWDESFPSDLHEIWMTLIEQLPMLSCVKIPRWVVSPQPPYSLLIFADASERAYCAAAYLVSHFPGGPQANLLIAKTKLAPVKPVSVPRLELCASLLAARVWKSLEQFYQRLPQNPKIFFFTDSMIVLSWVRTPPFQLHTFVANRVAAIQELTSPHPWLHVPSGDNPSDLGSRGLTPAQLVGNSLWFHGPTWASCDPSSWPCSLGQPVEQLPEVKTIGVSLISSKDKSNETPYLITWISSVSSYTKLLHSFSYVLRFCNVARKTRTYTSHVLSLAEIRRAHTILVRVTQAHEYFNDRLADASASMPKNLMSLNPVLDEAGIVLVGGRLRHSNISTNAKHPIILPAKASLSKLIMGHYHRALLHPGPTLLLAHLRTRYWITGARHAVRFISRTCVTCRKYDAPSCQPLMGDLPSSRFREGRAFLHTGIDFAGPFLIRDSLRRKAPTSKAYLCLFLCFSTRALHLELVSSLSTVAFLAALERFIGRRGLPERIFTDNGTNFIGAANTLKELYCWLSEKSTQDTLGSYATSREIQWVFTPPHAPEFGAGWEAGVKSVKRLMRTIYGDNYLTFEELSTLLIKIEALLNSRPLCSLSSDPDDLDFLTPGHFLIGSPLLAIPEQSLLDLKENQLSRWQLVDQKAQHYWQRWRLEYLTTLQERVKWRKPDFNFQIGDLVLLKEDQAPRLRWPIGRIIDTHPGKDGIVRVCTIRTSTSSIKRPSNKLIPLFCGNPDPWSIGSKSSQQEPIWKKKILWIFLVGGMFGTIIKFYFVLNFVLPSLYILLLAYYLMP